jgi:hypothetical protein
MPRFCPTLACLLFNAGLLACGSGEPSTPEPRWQLVQDELPAALLSVWGTGTSDVWSVGADAGDGTGPLVLHLEGGSWSRLETGASGDLWWVFGFEGGPIYMGGAGGTILRYEAGVFTRMDTPGNGVVFGLWGSAPDTMWAVGGEAGGARGAFAWRLEAGSWVSAQGFPSELAETDALWKIFGRGADDVWMVGTGGKMLHWDGTALSAGFAGLAESLFTVHGNGQRFAAVGGFGTGLLIEKAVGATTADPWLDQSPPGAPSLIGVCLADDAGYAVGEFGYVARRGATAWVTEETGLESVFGSRSLHSVWIDPTGGVWTVGGQVRVPPLTQGVMLHRGESVPAGLP